MRKHLGEILHDLASHKECEIVEGHFMADHVHICITIPPKYAVSIVVGYVKGKCAILMARQFVRRQRRFTGENFWDGATFISMVGLDEAIIRAYIRNQEEEDKRYDQVNSGM